MDHRTRRISDLRVTAASIVGLFLVAGSASAQNGFTEEAVTRGLDYTYDEFQVSLRYGCGVALIDLDEDGDPDAVTIGGASGAIGLFENDGLGQFIDRSSGSGLAPMPAASGIAAADHDGDGDLDLFVTAWHSTCALLRNDGGFTFTDVAAAAGVAGSAAEAGTGCAWADYDGDGRLDLYVANRTLDGERPATNHLYRNVGDGTFTDVAAALGVDDGQSPTFQPIFFDLDGDGDPDLYLSTDKGYDPDPQNRLYLNTNGTFTDITATSGTAANINSMGVAVGDFSHNGFADLYCTNTTQGNVLFTNQGDGTFIEPAGSNVSSNLIGWGAIFLDFDNDGWMELYVCNELGITGTPNAPNRLYDHDGSWPCVDRAAAMNVDDAARSFGSAIGDIDGDGDLDLLVQDSDRARLYVNHEGAHRRHLMVNVVGTGTNRHAVGANVSIRQGSVWRSAAIAAGGSYKSQHHRAVHFGAGGDSVIDEIVVAWPGGETRTLLNHASDRSWTAHPDAHLGDADGDGAVTFADFANMHACIDAPTFEPGCEIVDFDGDGAVDLNDGASFMLRYVGPIEDCNGNTLPDLFEILAGATDDDNGNGIPDGCETQGDVNGDGAVNIDDIVVIVTNWGPCTTPPAACTGDADGNGNVGIDDLVRVVLNWTG